MADFSITITVPNEKVDDLVNAMRMHYGPTNDGQLKTPAQIKAEFEADVKDSLREMYRNFKIAQQRQARREAFNTKLGDI